MATGDKTYTPELADEICRRLATGESLRSICRSPGMPAHPTVLAWALDNVNGFTDQYRRAREMGVESMADELLEISDNGSNDWMDKNDPDNPGYAFNGEHSTRSRLRVDSRKWLMSKIMPKKYGDKQEVDLNVKGDLTIAERLAQGRKRAGK